MQTVDLVLDHYNFYCPVTGQQIMGEFDDFKPSPAMVYCFVDEGESFEYALDWVSELYEKFMEENDDDCYEAYRLVVESMDPEKTKNLVCFSVQDASPFSSFGPAKLCFDMNYKEQE